MLMETKETKTTRRSFLKTCGRYGVVAGLAGAAGLLAGKQKVTGDALVWQIDPHKCIGCGVCAYRCTKLVSAVKCFQNWALCGYCDLCTGFFDPQLFTRDTGAENQMCPTDAFSRREVEWPYFEYIIDHDLCIGCGKCVDGCFALGNGSLFLQISQDLCLQCNQCAIALYCPTKAIEQIPAEQAYLLKEA
jgi:electron transport complex protein RnfB